VEVQDSYHRLYAKQTVLSEALKYSGWMTAKTVDNGRLPTTEKNDDKGVTVSKLTPGSIQSEVSVWSLLYNIDRDLDSTRIQVDVLGHTPSPF